MSLLLKGVTKLSQLEIDAHKDWAAHRIDNLGAPDSDDDALQRGLAILKAILTAQGEIIYASGAATPAALAPPASAKYLYHPGGAASPSWEAVAAGNFVLIASQVLTAAGSIDLTGLNTAAYSVLKLYLMGQCTDLANNVALQLQGDGAAHYWVERIWAGNNALSQNYFLTQSAINLGLVGSESDIFHTFAEVTIFNPNTMDKYVQSHLSCIGSAAVGMYTNLTGARYRADAAGTVTRITVFPSGTTFRIGAKAWLYGLT